MKEGDKRPGPLALLPVLALTACAAMDSNVARLDANVLEIGLGEAYPLSAKSLASGLLRAGFPPEEILEYGPKVRNAIGRAGGAQINKGRSVRAILSVQGRKLFISSRDSGTFIIDL